MVWKRFLAQHWRSDRRTATTTVRFVAVLFGVLITTSIFAPAVYAGAPTPQIDQPTESTCYNPTVETRDSLTRSSITSGVLESDSIVGVPFPIASAKSPSTSTTIRANTSRKFIVNTKVPSIGLQRVVWFIDGEQFTTSGGSCDGSVTDEIQHSFSEPGMHVVHAAAVDKRGNYDIVRWLVYANADSSTQASASEGRSSTENFEIETNDVNGEADTRSADTGRANPADIRPTDFVLADANRGASITTSTVSGTTLSLAVDSGTYVEGETVTASAHVENTGSSTHTFFVGFDVRGPNGNFYNNNGNTGTAVTLTPGEDQWVSLSWRVETGVPTGSYDAITAIWEESDPDNLHNRLDSTTDQNAFSVQAPGSIEGYVTDDDGDPLHGAKVYLDSVTDTRTDSNGYYSFSDVAAGSHEVYVTAGGCYNTPTKTVDVDGGQTTREDFRLNSQSYSVQLDSEPISVGTDGEGTYDCGTDVQISAPSTSGDYEFVAWETPDGTVWSEQATFTLDFITQDFDLTAQYKKAGKPDLSITDIRWEPSSPSEGDAVTFYVDIANRGEARATSFGLTLSLENDVFRATNIDLAAGDSTTIRLQTWDAVSGSYDVSSEVDFNGDVDEQDESNNGYSTTLSVGSSISTGTVRGQVTDANGNPIEGAKVYLDDTTDTRTDSSGYFEFTDVEEGQHKLEVRITGYENARKDISVTAGEVTTRNFELQGESYTVQLASAPVNVDATGAGTYQYGEEVRIEAPEEVDGHEFVAWETRDGAVVSERATFTIDHINRDYDLVAQYKTPGQPDLTINDIEWEPASPSEGDEVTFYVEIRNLGDARATSFDLEVHLENNIFRATDIDLASGRSRTIQLSAWEAVEGSYDISAEVDYQDSLDEEDETNNLRTETVRVESTATPTPTPTSTRTNTPAVTPTTVAKATGEIIEVRGVPQNYRENKWYEIQVIVRNSGETERTFSVEVPTPTGSEVDGSSARHVTVDAGATRKVDYRVRFYGTDSPRTLTVRLYSESGDFVDEQAFRSQPIERGTLAIEVMTQQGSPLSGATVSLRNTVEKSRETNSDGVATFEELPVGTYLVTIETADFRTKTRRLSLSPGQNSEEVVVTLGAEFGGRIVTESGDPVENAKVTIDGVSTRTNSEGEFGFDKRFAPASYLVRIEVGGEAYTRTVELHERTSQARELQIADPGGVAILDIRLSDIEAILAGEELSPRQRARISRISDSMPVFFRGVFFGEYGTKYPDIIDGVESHQYFAGWLGASTTKIIELLADMRDCNVKTNNGNLDSIDCAGFYMNVAGYGAQAIGGVASLTGGGALVGGPLVAGGSAAETLEEITDIATITTRWIKYVDRSSGARKYAERTVEVLRKYYDEASEAVKKYYDEASVVVEVLSDKFPTDKIREIFNAVRDPMVADAVMDVIDFYSTTGSFYSNYSRLYPDVRGVEADVVLPDDPTLLDELATKPDHIRQTEEIGRVLQEADQVYENGGGLYMWVKEEDGVYKIVRAAALPRTESTKRRLAIRTAYEVESWSEVEEAIDEYEFHYVG